MSGAVHGLAAVHSTAFIFFVSTLHSGWCVIDSARLDISIWTTDEDTPHLLPEILPLYISATATCEVHQMPLAAFTRFWGTDLTRECFLSHAARDDLRRLRLVSKDFAEPVANTLFAQCKVTFTVNTLSRPSRRAALDRIGHHIKHLEFNMPHSATTFLPPLLDPETGLEQHFIYEPYSNPSSRPTSSSSASTASSYGSFEMTDLLIKQWPPLFHAATDISSFRQFVSAVPNLRHLHISCPDQPAGQRYRRSCVDYALVSLRKALEFANLSKLTHLSLSPIHPSSMWYLRPAPLSLGSTPSSTRLWRQITHLDITIDSATHSTVCAKDHHNFLHSYLLSFPSLTSLQYAWRGASGPSPLSVHQSGTVSGKSMDMHWSTSTLVATPARPQTQLRFRRLRVLRLRNAVVSAPVISTFIATHRKVLDEVDFTDCTVQDGTWDDALRPLTSKHCPDPVPAKDHVTDSKAKIIETMDVPIVFSQAIESCSDERIKHMLWDEAYTPGGMSRLRALKNVVGSLRTRDVVRHCNRCGARTGSGAVESVKNFLKYSIVKWS